MAKAYKPILSDSEIKALNKYSESISISKPQQKKYFQTMNFVSWNMAQPSEIMQFVYLKYIQLHVEITTIGMPVQVYIRLISKDPNELQYLFNDVFNQNTTVDLVIQINEDVSEYDGVIAQSFYAPGGSCLISGVIVGLR